MSEFDYQITKEKLSTSRDGASASVTYLVPVTAAVAFAQTVVGGLRIVNGSPVYFIPLAYYAIPGLYCSKCDIDWIGDWDTSTGLWKTATATLTFEVLDQGQEEQSGQAVEVGDISYSLGGEELSLPKTEFHTGSISGPVLGDEAPNPIKVVAKGELRLSFKSRPILDPSIWNGIVGKINGNSWQGWAANTLMFSGVETRRSVSSDGTSIWSYDYVFQIQPNGWNNIWTKSGWQELFPHQYEETTF